MECTIGDIIALIALIFGAIGGCFAYLKWRKQTRVRYSEFVRDLIKSMRSDLENRETFYLIEYGNFKYSKAFHESEDEKKIDKLLTDYNYFCYLYMKSVIKKDEFGYVKYQIYRTLSNKHIQNYLFNIFHFSYLTQKEKDDTFSFTYLLRYGVREGIINENIYESNNGDYMHVLIA